MKYLSVCSGIESATVAWHPLGWEALGYSEIEKFPSAVLNHHYPDVPNFGDMCGYEEWPELKPDVAVAGTPCQSFSVAGLRRGMADPRGNLALVYLAVIDRFRPRWVVWENVPGVLSSNGGRDFGSFIGALVKLGYRVSWRVLDAQYFGVPQRRKRVFVVGHLGDWRYSAKVLFEPESMLRHPPPSRETGKRVAASLTSGAHPGSNAPGRRQEDDSNIVAPLTGRPYSDNNGRESLLVPDVTGTLDSRHAGGFQSTDSAYAGHLIPDVTGPLTSGAHDGGGLNGQDANYGRIIPVVSCPDVSPAMKRRDRKGPSSDGSGDGLPLIAYAQDVADPITANEQKTYTHEGSNNFRTRNVTAFDTAQITHPDNRSVPSDQSPTLAPTAGPPAIFGFKPGQGKDARSDGVEENVAPTLSSDHGGNSVPAVAYAIQERAECENPDAGPDGVGIREGAAYTLEARGKPQSVAFTVSDQSNKIGWESDVNPTLQANPQSDSSNIQKGIRSGSMVRRLTPTECERLQGFPDGYTNIPKASDSGRYRALGNAMAVPVMAWIGRRIQEVDNE